MNNIKRVVSAVSLGAALLGVLASPASAVPDPVATVDCAVQEVTGLVDPAGLGVPAEVPATGCLAP
ncbi:hypothetical protein GCM10010255_18320 [Streptomyces coeruleofuscus]|uniref:Secreted protein n=1 Tax=Streptomyces coeruleofuscus TaxID=66879 RepID=A0ABN3HXP9_9ACTN